MTSDPIILINASASRLGLHLVHMTHCGLCVLCIGGEVSDSPD